MASVFQTANPLVRPALATTYEGDEPALLKRLTGLVDAIEISPDAIATTTGGRPRLRPEVLQEYASVARHTKFVAHGVGLSIGSHDHWNEDYFGVLDPLFERLDPAWHSEHLACTTVCGENLGTMLAMPRTEEALDLICERVLKLQARYQVPFLLEHVIRLLPEPEPEHTDAAFLNALTRRTGCGLILDAYNLECDRHNFGFNVAAFLHELDCEPVMEMHVAGGVQHKGFQLDVHSRTTPDSALAIAARIKERSPNLRMITYEFLKEAIPRLGQDAICAELARIREVLIDDNACGGTARPAGFAETAIRL